ncbi:hypothetical protein [Salipiger sp. PrR003]|uniref:hypothetical protein n=1 Tax=Salipiger sp. PrR003 TaxID=2706776 RepID=UPI0013DB8598|nr:hypothetical protein [Salipiger sp. PrR003]NDV50545.1 hypothetical protein [Salipiger sp. PrR003]
MPRKKPNPRARKERLRLKEKAANKGKRSHQRRPSPAFAAEQSMSPGLAMAALGISALSSMERST